MATTGRFDMTADTKQALTRVGVIPATMVSGLPKTREKRVSM